MSSIKTFFQKCQRESILILLINNDTAKTTKVSELYLGFKKNDLIEFNKWCKIDIANYDFDALCLNEIELA